MTNQRPAFFRDVDRAKANNPNWERLKDAEKMNEIAKAAAERHKDEEAEAL